MIEKRGLGMLDPNASRRRPGPGSRREPAGVVSACRPVRTTQMELPLRIEPPVKSDLPLVFAVRPRFGVEKSSPCPSSAPVSS
jgi:hypothetical protein